MTVTYNEIPEEKTIALYVSGKVTKEDFNEIAPKIESFIQKHNTIKLLEVVSDLKGFEPSMIWSGIQFDLKHLKNISHCAVVSDMSWMTPFAKAAEAFTSTKLRMFDLNQVEDARTWLKTP